MRMTTLLTLFILLRLSSTASAYCFDAAAAQYQVNSRLLKAIAITESGLNA